MPPEANAPRGSDPDARHPPRDRATAAPAATVIGASSGPPTGSAAPSTGRGRWGRRVIGAFLVAWCAALVGPPLALVRWREARLAVLADPAAQANWDAFREDMRRQSGRDGPVQRKVPRSAEPPERVWLRDYVGLAIAAWVTLVGVLGGFLGLALRGLVGPGQTPGSQRPASVRQ